jgi:D-3-phosphoglycerate dehydrogenase
VNRFRVALSADFVRADGGLAIADFDLGFLSGADVEHYYLSPGGGGLSGADVEHYYLSPGGGGHSGEVESAQLEEADALILLGNRFTRDSVPASGRLAVVARFGVGYDTVDVAACSDNAIAVVITPDGVRRPVAVSIMTLMLALAGKLMVMDRLGRMGPEGWAQKTDHNGVGLVGRTLGSVGLGNIGAELFRLAKPFDMKFMACDPFADPEVAAQLGVELVDLETLFRRSDFLSVNCFLSEETRGLVNRERLALMKPSACLINTARGPIVDQAALTEALAERRIAAAGLDVLEQEPPDPDDPILQLDNAIITPHALCWTDQLFAGIGAADVKAVLDVMHGRVPGTVVNRDIVDDPVWRAKLEAYQDRFGS